MLPYIKIKKLKMLDVVWFIYLTLMMSYVFPGSQKIYTLCLLIVTIIHIIIHKRAKFSKIKYSGFIWYCIFAILVNVSTKWSVYNYNYTGITNWVIYISCTLFCLDYAFDNNEDCINFFVIFTYAGVVFSIIALITSPLSTYCTDAFSGITGQYRTWIGGVSAILVGINFCLHRYYHKGKVHVLFALVNLGTVLASGARGALLTIIIICVIFLIKEKNYNKKMLYILVGIIGIACGIFIVFKNSALYSAFIERVLGAIYNDGSTNSVNERAYFMRQAYELFKIHPVIGGGVDTVRGYLNYVGYWHVTYSHCQYLELLASYGILGTFIFFYPLIKAFVNKRKNYMFVYIVPILLCTYIWSVEYYSFIYIILMERLQTIRMENQH